MKIIITLVLTLLITCPVLAGDYATLNFIGFSKDGKYLAFEEYGTTDGSGWPYSNVFVIDVEKNSFATTPVRIMIERDGATEVQARTRAKTAAVAALRKHGIIDRNTGSLVVSRLFTDLTLRNAGKNDDATMQTINFAEIIGSMYRAGDYELVMRSKEVTSKECDKFGEPARLIEIQLKDNEAKSTVMLQKDTALPASRGCPLSYEMQFVYLYQDHIAVFVNTFHMGFEGPDMRFMVVTGKFK